MYAWVFSPSSRGADRKKSDGRRAEGSWIRADPRSIAAKFPRPSHRRIVPPRAHRDSVHTAGAGRQIIGQEVLVDHNPRAEAIASQMAPP